MTKYKFIGPKDQSCNFKQSISEILRDPRNDLLKHWYNGQQNKIPKGYRLKTMKATLHAFTVFFFQIREVFSSISRQTGEPDLQKALSAAKRVFDEASPRPNAKKVLVIIIDKKASDTQEEIQGALKPLKEDNVKVVPVAVGPDVDVDQLKNTTSAEGYLVEADKTTTPTKLAKDIMDKVTSGIKG